MILTAFNYFLLLLNTCYYFLLNFQCFVLHVYYFFTTVLLLFLLFCSICCCCICTTYLLHVYYLLLHVHYFFTTCLLLVMFLIHFTMFVILCYYFLLRFTILYHVLLILYIFTVRLRLWYSYPGVIITWVHYLGPPGHSTSQILGTFSRFSETFLAERERGGVPRGSSRSLGDPP